MIAAKSALVVYPFMPSYRFGVFSKLDASSEFDFTFASDVTSNNGVPALPSDTFRSHVLLKTTLIGALTWQKGLLRHLLGHKYDVVIFLGDVSHLSTWIAAGLLRLRGCRVYFWTIGWHRPEAGLKRVVRLIFYRLANGLLLYGEMARTLGLEHGYPAQRMRVIGNSHVAPVIVGRNRKVGVVDIVSSHPVVGAIIRLNEVKRLDLLIHAAAELQRRGDPVTVVLVGEGPAREALEQLARRLGVDARFPGAIYDADDIARIYAVMLLTVVPCAVGLTAIQSLDHGVPVVTDSDSYSQMPEWEAVREGITGGMFDPGNHVALADVIARWLKLVQASRDEIAVQCRAEVEARWTPDVQAHLIGEVLRSE